MGKAWIIALLGLAACATQEGNSFDISAIRPTVEADQQVLTGWFEMSEGFREFKLYPSKGDVGKPGPGKCISGAMLSLAGVPTPDFNGQKMTITGSIHRAGSAEAGATPDTCGSGLIMLAMNVSTPD